MRNVLVLPLKVALMVARPSTMGLISNFTACGAFSQVASNLEPVFNGA